MKIFTSPLSLIAKTCSKGKVSALLVLVFLCFGVNSTIAQNAIVGAGFTNGWNGSCTDNTNFEYFAASAGTSFIRVETPNGTGNQFFRLGIDWSGTIAQRTITPGSDVQVNPNTTYTLNGTCTSSGAMFINVPSLSNRYVFKTQDAGPTPAGNFVVFELGGDPVTVTGVTQNPLAGNVQSGQGAVVTATLSAPLPTGQAVYIRYTTNNYTNSTVAQLSGSGTSYSFTIPAATNASGANVSYYVFTSGTSGVAADASNANLYTINSNTNSGANYNYTVLTPSAIYLHNFNTAATASPYTVQPTATTPAGL
jgi:hypothetical protein